MQQRYYRAAKTNNFKQGEGEHVVPSPNEFESPALLLGKRIKKEQGRDRAYEFLGAMEPFLAPGERELIASQLGVAIPEQGSYSRANKAKESASPGGAAGAPDNMAGFLKLMQLMNGFSSPAGAQKTPGAGGGPDPAMLAKLMGMLK